jgi:hypothetical protein
MSVKYVYKLRRSINLWIHPDTFYTIISYINVFQQKCSAIFSDGNHCTNVHSKALRMSVTMTGVVVYVPMQHAMKTCRGRGGKFPRILNLDTRWMIEVSFPFDEDN